MQPEERIGTLQLYIGLLFQVWLKSWGNMTLVGFEMLQTDQNAPGLFRNELSSLTSY